MPHHKKEDFVPVSFIPAKSPEDRERTEPSNSTNNTTLDGLEVKSFYEDVVGLSQENLIVKRASSSSDSSSGLNKHTKSAKHVKADKPYERTKYSHSASVNSSRFHNIGERHVNRFLKAAQTGDMETLQAVISKGIDLNCQDHYGWTAAMCAIHEGQAETLGYLLQCGADLSIANKQGVSAKTMSKQADTSSQIRDLVHDYIHGVSESKCVSEKKVEPNDFCDSCQMSFNSKREHYASTVHLLNTKSVGEKSTTYGISENNPGYQMMLRSGWNREEGLGPDGKGQKFPVKTLLKSDRLGLGSEIDKSKVRVTHFSPNDAAAVKSFSPSTRILRQGTLGRRDRNRKLAKEKQKERKFRLEFSAE